MKFSVVIPLYNKRAYIARCLQSVFEQTHVDFDLVVVDDGSTDDSECELQRFRDNRLRCIHQANQGVSVARNNGLAAAHHDVVFFLDADDTWESGFLDKMKQLVSAYPEAGVYACGTRKVFANGQVSECALDISAFVDGTAILCNYFQTFVDIKQSPFSNSSFGVRKNVFLMAGEYTAGVKLTEDSDLWVRLALISPIAFDPTPLANYFVEIENNTRVQAQTADYEVIRTLKRVLAAGQVSQPRRSGLENLLALQKHAQIKRLILLGDIHAAWRRLLDADVWKARPLSSLLLAVAASLPRGTFVWLRRLAAYGR